MNDLTTWFESVLRGLSRAHSRGASNLAYAGGFVVAVVAISAIALVVPGNRLGEIVEYSICKVVNWQDSSSCAVSEAQKMTTGGDFDNRAEQISHLVQRDPSASMFVSGDSFISGEGSNRYIRESNQSPTEWYYEVRDFTCPKDYAKIIGHTTVSYDYSSCTEKLIRTYNSDNPEEAGVTTESDGGYIHFIQTRQYGENGRCHRAVDSAAEIVANGLGIPMDTGQYINVACSGDTFDTVAIHTQDANVDPNKVLLLDMSIGGNNLDFAGIITKCAGLNGPIEGCTNNNDPKDGTPDDYDSIYPAELPDIISGKEKIRTRTPDGYVYKTYRDYLVDLYTEAKEKYPNATIMMQGYPRFWSENPDGKTHAIHELGGGKDLIISSGEKKWMNQQSLTVNNLMKDVANEVGVTYVDTYELFKGHEVDSAEPWINGIYFTGREGNQDNTGVLDPNSGSMHPNKTGYREIANEKLRLLQRMPPEQFPEGAFSF